MGECQPFPGDASIRLDLDLDELLARMDESTGDVYYYVLGSVHIKDGASCG
jgi:hypothetical protein